VVARDSAVAPLDSVVVGGEFLVADSGAAAAPRSGWVPRPVLDVWVRSRGGRVVESSRLEGLLPAVRAAVAPAARRAPWHPMRSAWWLLPFAGLLAFEWYLRRRGATVIWSGV
jgi:hypothetical protein